MDKNHVSCEGSGYYAKDINDGFADCPYCKERRAVRSDGSIRSHRGKRVYLTRDEVKPVVVDEVVIELTPEVPPAEVSEEKGFNLDRPAYIISLVDGVAIGWDTCGRCFHHLRSCYCKDPQRPDYIVKMISTSENKES